MSSGKCHTFWLIAPSRNRLLPLRLKVRMYRHIDVSVQGILPNKKGSHYLESNIWASALLHNSTFNYKWFFKGKKTIVSVTQTHSESSTYENELTERALLFFRSLRNDDGDDYATKTSLKKIICAASNLRACLHGVGDPGLVGLVSFVFTLWWTQNKRNLPH